ncbi:MAG TPA: aminotransferase class IV [Pyrinomonadaceae bacterium]|jgi:branched-subunit amino acid aminotransferase/4-amino-4-deoxychorismate lyase|nr:aminotransferase class IV [Pyrinomonadaceae bacterium]
MHPVIYLNKVMLEATKARVAPVSSAMLYGRGVFTTVAIYNGGPFLWPEHWRRLSSHAEKLNVECAGLNERNVGEDLRKLCSVNQVKSGRARVILLARSGRDVWRTKKESTRKTDLLIMTGEPQKVPAAGMSLAVSPYRVNTMSPLVGIRSLNYLEQVLSWEEAQSRDFDEAVTLNERGEIVSATMANIFWFKDGTLHTPALSTGTIAGITRAAVLELAAKQFIPAVEGVYELADLTDADEIFLTSASLGVAQVTTFDFRRYSLISGNSCSRLSDALRELTAKL